MHLPFCLSLFLLIQNSSWHIKHKKCYAILLLFSFFPRLSGPNKVHDCLNTTNRSTVNIYKLKYLLVSLRQNHKKKLCANIHTHISINTANKTRGSVLARHQRHPLMSRRIQRRNSLLSCQCLPHGAVLDGKWRRYIDILPSAGLLRYCHIVVALLLALPGRVEMGISWVTG